MALRSASLVLLCAAWLNVACSGSDDGSGGGGANGTGPSCGIGEVAVTGTLDGTAIDVSQAETGHIFVNKLSDANPGALDISTDKGSLSIEFNKLVPNGGSTAARGSFQDSDASLDVGNCETGEFVSSMTLDEDGDGGKFVLRSLSQAPYCGGQAVVGDLTGCFRYPAR